MSAYLVLHIQKGIPWVLGIHDKASKKICLTHFSCCAYNPDNTVVFSKGGTIKAHILNCSTPMSELQYSSRSPFSVVPSYSRSGRKLAVV